MSNGIIFDQDSARRIANATRGYEQSLGEPERADYQVADGSYGRLMLVRTGTLPAGYTGSMAAPGSIIEKMPDGTVNVIASIWIKDINGTALGANVIYQARFSGSFTQDVTVNGIVTPTTYGLYLVQSGSGGSLGGGSGLAVGSSISGRISGYNVPGAEIVSLSATLPNGLTDSFRILNVGGGGIITDPSLFVHGMAIVSNVSQKTAYLSTVFPFLVQGECEKDGYGNASWIGNNRIRYPVFDPLKLSIKFGSYFYGIMVAPCSYIAPPFLWLYMATQYGWSTNRYDHPWAQNMSTGGIGSGIGSGISGV